MEKFKFFIHLILIFFSNLAFADFHTVGWVNTFLPGGGRLVMEEYKEAAKEAALEMGTFGVGYSISPYGNFTLDGTPIGYPTVGTYNYLSKTTRSVCVKRDPKTKVCTQYANRTSSKVISSIDYNPTDSTKPLTAALLQEFGLKYHIMNVFLSYRDQFNKEGGSDPGQGIDQRSTYEMLKDPFRSEVLLSPWVYVPIALTSAFVYLDYRSQFSASTDTISPLNKRSKVYTAFDQMVMYPIGSAAPEETFYRGFLQNEFYYLYRSPYFAVPMSSLFFALSHAQDGWPSAFATGLYQGTLAYRNHGDLSYGNAVHFWGVVVLGIEAYLLTLHSQAHAPPAALNFSFTY